MTQRPNAKARTLCIVAAVAIAAAGLIVTAQAEPKTATSEPAPAYKPAQPIEKMMRGQDKLFKEVRAGILDQKWKDASLSAWILAEIANANQYQNDDPEYRKYAARMSEQAVELAGMLSKQDEKGAMSQVSAIGQTCQACHDKFKK